MAIVREFTCSECGENRVIREDRDGILYMDPAGGKMILSYRGGGLNSAVQVTYIGCPGCARELVRAHQSSLARG